MKTIKFCRTVFILFSIIVLSGCTQNKFNQILLNDDFSALDTGLFSAQVGAHTEYHFLPEAAPKGNWVVSSFASGDNWGRAWQVKPYGTGKEYFVHNPNINQGGVFDGLGIKVLQFPDDGHPDMCNATLDLTGDCRDEIVVWDQHQIWIYTQSDNPKTGKLYKPVRNPLYNYSNYQATVSLPGWNE